MRFKDIIGQQEVKSALARVADSGRVSHAQLFTGGEGTGALPLVMAFAQYINCENRSGGDSCGVCRSCVQMEALAHPDTHFIFPVNKSKSAQAVNGIDGDKPVSDNFIAKWRELVLATGGYFDEQTWYKAIDIDNKQGIIGIAEAREIIRKLSFKAFESRYKIVIMWLPERMNIQAANALLKILEEPWENTFFLLVSENPSSLLPTILSRTQEVSIPAIDTDDLTEWLVGNMDMPQDKALGVAHLSMGNLLEAERLASGEESDEEGFDMFVRLMRLAYEDRHLQLMEWAENAAAMGREGQKRMLEKILRLLRDSYMLSMGVDDVAYLHGRELDFCRKFAPFVNNGNIESLMSETESVVAHIARNGNPKIIFTHYVLTVSKLIGKKQANGRNGRE